MKLAYVAFCDIPHGGASANRLMMLGRGLSSLGHEVHILVPYRFSGGPLCQEIDGATVHWGASVEPRVTDALGGRLRKRALLYKSARDLLWQGLDWLILCDMGLDGLPFLRLARHYGCRVAGELVDTRWLSKKPTLRELFYLPWYKGGHLLVTPRLDLILVISRYLENQLLEIAPRVPRLIVPAPVDLTEFKPRKAEAQLWRRRYGLKDSLVIGYFGSKWSVKGLDVLIRAVGKLRQGGKKPFKLLITGKSANETTTKKLIMELGLQEHLILPGFLPFEELPAAMTAADILVEPKIGHLANEAAFPQKVAEYLSMGKAVVTTAVGDIPFFLKDQEDVLLCPPGDHEALAGALNRLLEDNSLRARLGLKGGEAARNHFDCRLLAQRIDLALRAQQATVQ
jgi:glycosyltransferase involved in cell wall biosynthesis